MGLILSLSNYHCFHTTYRYSIAKLRRIFLPILFFTFRFSSTKTNISTFEAYLGQEILDFYFNSVSGLQAMECFLAGVRPANGQTRWHPHAVERFEDLSQVGGGGCW